VGRLAIALPAVLRAAMLLIWPASLSSITTRSTSRAYRNVDRRDVGNCRSDRRSRDCAVVPPPRAGHRVAAGIAALSYLPTANLFYSAGVVLAERNLYLPAALPAALVGWAATWVAARRGLRPAAVAMAIVAIACEWRSFARLPAWRDNRSQLVTLLADHPESYRAHASAAAVFAGTRDTAAARREYRMADSLFPDDRYLNGANAIFLIGIGDTAAAVPLIDRGGDRM